MVDIALILLLSIDVCILIMFHYHDKRMDTLSERINDLVRKQ